MKSNLGTLVLKFVGDVSGLQKAFNQANGMVSGAGGLGFGGMSGAMAVGNLGAQAITKSLELGWEAAKGIASAMYDTAKYVAVVGAEFERAETAFQTLTGSTSGGSRLFGEVQKLATETPFKSQELIENAKLLLGYGIPAKDLLRVMREIGNVASGTGAPIHNIALAYGQVLAKGKLTAEELNRQLGNAGIGAETIAEAMGMPTQKLLAMMQDGQVSAKMFQDAFTKLSATGGRFAGAMERDLQTVGGRWDQLIETFQLGAGKLGTAIFQRLPIGKMLEQLTNGLNTVSIDKLVDGVQMLWQTMQPVVVEVGKFGLGVAYVAEQFIGKLYPAASDMGKGVSGTIGSLGPMLVSFATGAAQFIAVMVEGFTAVGGVIFDMLVRPMSIAYDIWRKMNGEKVTVGETADRFAKSMDAMYNSARGIQLAIGQLNTRKAFGEADKDFIAFTNRISGRGGVSPVSKEQERAMAAAAEVKARNAAFMDAMDAAMPGFRTGISDLLKDATDPTKSQSAFSLFERNWKYLQGAKTNPDLFGGMDAINRAIFQQWSSVSGSLNSLPDPVAKTIRAGSQEAYSAINQARADANYNVEADIRMKLDVLREVNERQVEYQKQAVDALNRIADERRVGVGIGGGR